MNLLDETDYGLSNPIRDKNVVISGDDSEKEEGVLSNPLVKKTVTTWDCVYFGNYWQNDTNGDGKVNQSDKKQPIKWRVLSVDGNNALLLADQNLDCQPYNNKDCDVTWETCTLRSWLNSAFLDSAFSKTEQSAIKTTSVINKDNPHYETPGGKNTIDKVYLLSVAEASNEAYGFNSNFLETSKTREGKTTLYAKGRGAWTSTDTADKGSAAWWLRSPGLYSDWAAAVYPSGHGNLDGGSRGIHAYFVNGTDRAIRPALYLDLSSSLWRTAGKVTVSDGVCLATWDCVYFGNYWQNDTNGNGIADKNDEKQPIKWRVLSVDGNDAFLLADQNLDCQPYNEEESYIKWDTCTLRSWLNSAFLDSAFSKMEQSAIKNSTVINKDNPEYGTSGCNDTTDKVYLLSIEEASNPAYGFSRGFDTSRTTRGAENTAYAKECGARTSTDTMDKGNGLWWLRSPGHTSTAAAFVEENGDIFGSGCGSDVNDDDIAIRPVLHLNLSSSLWKAAGKVTLVEKELPSSSESTPIATSTKKPSTTIVPSRKKRSSSLVIPVMPKMKKVTIKSVKNKKGKKAVVRWKKVKGASGYQIAYAANRKLKKKKTKNVSKTMITLKKLKKKKTYYIKVRAYKKIKGKKVYGKWSKVKKIKIKK